MSTRYPTAVDTTIQLPTIVNNSSPVNANSVNILRDAILAVEQELGDMPSSTYATVRSRLDTIETNLDNLNLITIGGDLDGYDGYQRVIALYGLPLLSTAPSIGNTLFWSGFAWGPSSLNLAGGSNYVSGLLPSSNQGPQILNGDAIGTTAASSVVSLTGTDGYIYIAPTATSFMWDANTSEPTITQANTGSTNASSLIIIAQSSNATLGNGGSLVLSSGNGNLSNGEILLSVGGEEQVSINGNGLSLNISLLSINGGNFTLLPEQYTRILLQFIGTLSSNATIVFPNTLGMWFISLSGLTLNGHTINFQSGSGTTNAISSLASSQLFIVSTYGGNQIELLS